MLGNTDRPINSIANDTFGISSYVDGLCSFIVNCDTPMTVSIQGDWGSGKTSMMNMIKEKISNSVCPIWFNTWQFSQFKMQDELSASLLYSLLSELDYSQDNIKKIFGFLSGAARIATGVLTEKVAGGYLAGEITDKMTANDYDSAQEIKNLKSKFQEAINEKIRKENKDRVVIFVDDLDRLQPEKAVELLEVLKVFLDCENCVYVLAVDYEVVTQGIKKKFGDTVGEQKGKSFFDKIIQLPFKMPVQQYDISKYVSDMLIKMNIEADEKAVADYVALISLSVGCNPRSMKRLFNTYLLLDIILKGKFSKEEKDKVNLLLFAIICMQTEFEELYRYIVSARDVIDGDLITSFAGDMASHDEILSELGVDDEKFSRISNFMTKLGNLLQESDSDISEDNINRLKELLSFSTITSVNVADGADSKTDYDWKYRYINKDIAKSVNDELSAKYSCDFRIWLPKKNTKTHRISDVWGTVDLRRSKAGFIFDYSLRTNYSVGITDFNMSIYHDKTVSDEEFDRVFCENPLPYSWEKNTGNVQYKKVLRFSDIEAPQVKDKLVETIKNAVEKIEKHVNDDQ